MLSDEQINAVAQTMILAKHVPNGQMKVFAREIENLVRIETNLWRETIIDALCAAHIYTDVHDINPQKALNDLLCWEAKVALDPAVSADARKLQDDARAYPAAVPRAVLEAWERLDAWWKGMLDSDMENATLEQAGVAEWTAMAAAIKGVPAEPDPLAQVEIAALESSVGHLSALVDDLRGLLNRAISAMTALHESAQPDEGADGVPAIIPGAAFEVFVNEHAVLLYARKQRHSMPPVEPAPQRQPLSDAQIAAAVRKLYSYDQTASMGLPDDITTARCIEAAHGIGD